MSYIVAISGSPSSESRSSILTNYLKREAEQKGIQLIEISVLDFEPEVLIRGIYGHLSYTGTKGGKRCHYRISRL